MRFVIPVSALLFSVLILAQDASIFVGIFPGTPAAPVFFPPAINATTGSVISFVFAGTPGNHTVFQSDFHTPCQPLRDGFDSGFVFVPAEHASTFHLMRISFVAIWFYCAQAGGVQGPHCPSGTVGAINADDISFELFQSNAKAQTTVVAPIPALYGVNAVASAPPGPLIDNASLADGPRATSTILTNSMPWSSRAGPSIASTGSPSTGGAVTSTHSSSTVDSESTISVT
ncbi:hypothetical protein GY45DRAFT_1225302, partial [Cubamyces sp. BRFM 1775]